MMEVHSTSDELSQHSEKSQRSEQSEDIEADYGQEEEQDLADEAYAFEKEEDNILDKDEGASEVEEYMEAMEEQELLKGDLKDDDDYGSESGQGLDDYGSDDAELNAFDEVEDQEEVEDEEEEIE